MDAPSTYESVYERLRGLRRGALIGIEGFCSAGKSRLADRLGAELNADVIHTDSFAAKFDQPPPYLDCLYLRRLSVALAARDKAKYCAVEGICLRDALARCNAQADFYLYIRRMARSGLWHNALMSLLMQLSTALMSRSIDLDRSQDHPISHPYRRTTQRLPTTSMKIVTVESWEHFEECVAELNAYLLSKKLDPVIAQAKPLYRGHADATWTLTTTLERFRAKTTSVERYNRYLLRIKPAVESFTEKHWVVEREVKLSDDWLHTPPNYEFMVYARHHGFPSPLLDWSQSPYIALYFAYSAQHSNSDAAVYAYVSTPEGVKGGWARSATINELGPYATTHARHFRQQAQYTVCVHKPEEHWEYCSHENVFKSGDDSQDLLRKFILPSSHRLNFLRKLQLMNINAYSLFNTEEALMQMLAFKEITLHEL